MNTFLGIELGSTRIKAMTIDEAFQTVSAGSYTWAASYENGVWTYPLEEVWTGLKTALSNLNRRENIAAMGISAMMHGYLAFDRDWNLLVPFRTWQNTSTGPAATELTELFGFNIPQRWSVAFSMARNMFHRSPILLPWQAMFTICLQVSMPSALARLLACFRLIALALIMIQQC